MDVISIGILAFSALCIVLGLILGLIRGLSRSVLRIAIIIVCAVIALVGSVSFTDSLLQAKIAHGQTIVEYFKAGFASQEGGAVIQSAMSIIEPLLHMLIAFISYLIIFGVLQLVTWIIVFPLLKIVICVFENMKFGAKKERKANGIKVKKYRFFGMLVGAVQGVLIACLICGPITYATQSLSVLENKTITISETETINTSDMLGTTFSDYNNSTVGKLFGATSGAFKGIFTAKNEKGEDITFAGYIDAFVVLSDMSAQLSKLTNIQISEEFNQQDVEQITDVLRGIEEVKNAHPQEAVQIFSDMAQEVIGAIIKESGENITEEDIPFKIEDLDIAKIDFNKEADVIEKLYEFSQTEDFEEGQEVELIETISESQFIMQVVESSDLVIEIDDASEVLNAIDAANISTEKKEMLKKLFGAGATQALA